MTKGVRRILVAVDLSKPRDAAFDRALLLARGWNADLYLLDSRRRRPVSRLTIPGEEGELERRKGGRSHLRTLVRSAEDAGVQVQVISAQGDQASAIAAHAHLVVADLIVVGRDFGWSRMWRAPRVAATVGRSAPVPVLIEPSRKSRPHDPEAPFKRVVIAGDFTVASAFALAVADDVIAQSNGRGTVIHAVSSPASMAFSGGEASGVRDELRGQLAQAEARLRGTIPAGAKHRVEPRVVAGVASRAILDVAAEVDADLVVMGVSRRNRLDELVFGSTFQRVVRRSLRPILAVPIAAGAYRWAGTLPAHVVSGERLRAA